MAALPAVSKTYSARGNVPYQANTSLTDLVRSVAFSLVGHMLDTLVGGTLSGSRHANSVWTVRYSCDSVTAGTAGDGVNRWGALTNLIFAANGVAHSWFVLRNATLGYEVCVDCIPAVAGSPQIGLVVAEMGVPFSGGTTLTRPTSANEFAFGTTNSGSASTVLVVAADNLTGNFNWTHYITADDGQFYFLCSRTGLGVFSTFLGLQKTGTIGADTRNVFAMGHSTIAGRGAPTYDFVGQSAAGCTGRLTNGSANSLGGIQNAGTFGASDVPNIMGVDSTTGNYLAFPCAVATLAAAQPAYRGVLPDQYSVGTAPVGGSIPSAAAQARVIAGDFIIPFPGVNPTM